MTAQEQAELERRLNRLRANIDAKRRARGGVEIEDGVWIYPDRETTPNLTVVNPPPVR